MTTKKMDMQQFHADQKLDPTQLDLAACVQGEMFFHWAEQAVAARRQVDRAKLNLELVESQRAMEIRNEPQNYGLQKVTEAGIKEMVKVQTDYREAADHLLDARHESGLLDAAVTAMEQRKRMIEVLITLHGQQYFAGPSVPRDLGAAWSKYQQDRIGALADRQRARVRKTGKVKR